MTDLQTRAQNTIAAVTEAAEPALTALRDAAGAALGSLTGSVDAEEPAAEAAPAEEDLPEDDGGKAEGADQDTAEPQDAATR